VRLTPPKMGGTRVAAFENIGLEEGNEALRRFLVGDDDLNTMLTKIILITTEAVSGCDLASITLIRDGKPMTPVFTEKIALALDESQYASGDGPCLAAIRHRGVEQSTTASEERWPAFNAAAARHGVVATLSVPLVDGETAPGGLNLYSKTAPFDDEAQRIACAYADQLGLAAANAASYKGAAELAEQLQEALESRAVIEQAKGILMAAQKCSPDAAFDILRRASQNQNRKLRHVATDIVNRYAKTDGID
jgi:GAF domain-containing protein